MLIREGEQRTIAIDLKLAALLAGVAGAINAAGFQATGFFSANMTGNVSALSDHFGQWQLRLAGFFAVLVLGFIAGALASGLLIEAGRRRGIRAIYAYSITLEAALLFVLGIVDITFPSGPGNSILVLGLSFVMGLQNAATTRISNARVRTTHVSGMATDIGLALASLASAAPDREAARARLKLYLSTIAAFLAGGIAGVIVYVVAGGYLFLMAAAMLLTVALPEIRRANGAATAP